MDSLNHVALALQFVQEYHSRVDAYRNAQPILTPADLERCEQHDKVVLEDLKQQALAAKVPSKVFAEVFLVQNMLREIEAGD